ncbi:DNA-binding NarL/FixJ family response regulator [Variovorax boronicumulans]|uniref:DNA-binding NarL/FixJ family response regulator n=1 Tax=Variovorax boronicumulans TaxID=436515 RepID=A0AAW8DAK9_9BURK|nr:response regulator transcription factor [Variovorax boronicumulans]MDP9897349.1 DNA-binding NarL/FixJ family response regulator [Variovorax boronicumulans]MDQ0057417.1 DNA-binding NarL/FixJ family response regulator [Variovorax boronicumulans]
MKSILIVEDHPFVAKATTELITQNHPAVDVVVVNSAQDALRLLDRGERDWKLILLDLDIPDAIGLSLAMDIKARGLHGITCILTGIENKEYIAQARANGFLGYVLKAIAVGSLEIALLKVLSGERAFPDEGLEPLAAGVVPVLTRRQLEVIRLVGEGKTSKEIAKILSLAPGTVNDHVEAAMAELEVNSRAHAVQKALQMGLLRIGNDASGKKK